MENEDGISTILLPSYSVKRMQLDVLHHSGSIDGSLATADCDGAARAHLIVDEKHCRQPPVVFMFGILSSKYLTARMSRLSTLFM